MRLLDLYCGAGGASVGYRRAGFQVTGVDIRPQPNYPFEFERGDALQVLRLLIDGLYGETFDAIHASPPCQLYSKAWRIRAAEHPDLVEPTRDLLNQTGLPWVIENVPGAPLHNPVVLEGQMFDGLRTQRKRWFETNWPLQVPFLRSPRPAPNAKMGRKPRDHEWVHVVGNQHSPSLSAAAMGIDWKMSRTELSEAIPPAYSEFIGTQLLAHLKGEDNMTPAQAHRRDTYRLGYQHGRRIAAHGTSDERTLRLELQLSTQDAHRAFALGELRGYRSWRND